MAVISCDFETYYSNEYSLRKMSEVDYILDPRFQTIMCSVKEGRGPSDVFVGHEAVAKRFEYIDWSRSIWLSHNTRFDGAIALWHYGIRPAMYACTLSMARALTHAVVGRSSLEKVSDYLGLPPKGKEVVMAMGKRLEDFTPAELAAYKVYCNRDNDNCKDIFDIFLPKLPKSELRLIDTIIRMFVEPQVYLDANVLAEHLHDVRVKKAAIMARVAHIDKSVFSSSIKFAALLEEHGVDPPRKISPTTGQEIFALAKNDRAFKELYSDDTQPLEVQALLAARVNAKSTLEETRTQSLLNLSLRKWQDDVTGWAPVPLKYWGARTGRLSGDGGFNWQNFARGSRIREAVVAPPGYRIVHRDASQIEARMVAFLAGCQDILNAFSQKRDIYSEFSTETFGRKITKADAKERFVGKTGILSLQYGVGAPRFRHALFIGANGINYVIDEVEARRIVYLYRRRYHEIPTLWNNAEIALNRMLLMSTPLTGPATRKLREALELQADPIPCIEVGHEALWMPNGMCIAYPDIKRETRRGPSGQMETEVSYADPYGGRRHLYGAKVVENVSQGLSRIIVTDAISRVAWDTGYHPFLSTHDSLDYCVPESEAEAMDARLEREFRIRPWWAPTLPLASEGGFGKTMLDAEKAVNL